MFHMFLIPALGLRWTQKDQSHLHRKLQARQGYTRRPCLKKHKRTTTKDTFTVFRKLKFTIVFPNLIQSIKL